MARIDHYQAVTDRVIAALESGTAPWQKDWHGSGGMAAPLRHNGEAYRGINVLLLWIAAMEKGYSAPTWMTFKQAKALGACVRKGEKGTPVVYFNVFEKEDSATGETKKIPFLKGYTVFNVEQIDGLPESFYPESMSIDTGARAIDEMENFFAATGANIVTRGNQPCYRPASDTIEMPRIEQFNSPHAYYGTLAHETIHWTGHASRLDRLNSSAKEDYAFEELIAELGSLFVCTQIGAIPNFDNSAAYLNSWLAALRNDKRFIFKAATAAQNATDYILEKVAASAPALAA